MFTAPRAKVCSSETALAFSSSEAFSTILFPKAKLIFDSFDYGFIFGFVSRL
jgi:hypothetical protein